MAAADSPAAPILCKQQPDFTCPIVTNMSTDGSDYAYGGGAESAWTATGPWGGGGSTITVGGNSRCSFTDGKTYGRIGDPSTREGEHCWCQMVNAGFLGAWAYRGYRVTVPYCVSFCAFDCASGVRDSSAFRPMVCVPPASQPGPCDGTVVIANGACPAGYAKCVGTGAGDDAKGRFTITCSE
jgi:hypothetical protein